MGDQSAIEWTEATWNPLAGCSLKSDGCKNCYAMREAHRLGTRMPKYAGLTRIVNGHPVWTGELRAWEPHFDQPLRWTKPRRIFVNSMSDLFHEKVEDQWLERIFTVMVFGQLQNGHVFQVLTKRPERMLAWLADWYPRTKWPRGQIEDPLRNIWLGVSVEDQATADERIPLLLDTPAAVRWVSYEPALGPVDFGRYLPMRPYCEETAGWHGLDWLVVGGESGPGARTFDVAWARSTIAQSRAAGIPVFVKQLGARPYSMTGRYGDLYFGAQALQPAKGEEGRWYLSGERRDRKGGSMEEWPENLRVREYPR